MRIDLNIVAVAQPSLDREANQVRSNPSSSHPLASARKGSWSATPDVESQDKTTFSAESLRLSSLASTALESPPVRQDKVDAISQALRSGQYELNPSKIADAIVSDRVR